ncbi:circularly permuted type 2 ATP-grasp protein [Chrysiogenes arsenatis]|uniref:circularly permuted type 2 ATP-grasp protein n=1 Tax=Chrysiogenes arsenatis TaxID=309797 RepID=UPI0004050846|nr:circularly permuted type 2 ATP-grasp protein [Chrysiogenes arsenatis]
MTTNESIPASYIEKLRGFDEMLDANSDIRPHWNSFMSLATGLEAGFLERSAQEIRRLLRENGVTYHFHDDAAKDHRPWELDIVPLLISSEEWHTLEKGLTQRAELLNLILEDIYGPQNLIRQGHLPMEVVYAHNGFARQCAGIRLPGNHQLIIYGADIARSTDGVQWVMSDRTQAVSGLGYTLENRTAMARTLPNLLRECKAERLAPFFRSLRESLSDITPEQKANPRTVLLTTGPIDPTYFEHAYLAAYLGYTLVQPDDLTVRDGRLWLKSINGLQPVDIILRRTEDSQSDPLELGRLSSVGIPGLIEVVRRGNVAVANPIGSAVLENPGLFPFLPTICKVLLGEEILLPSAPTWWCGQPLELGYVLEHLNELDILSIHQVGDSHVVAHGPLLSKRELEALRRRILARPYLYAGQRKPTISTSPTLVDGNLTPRPTKFRTFMTASLDNYILMPGGLARAATSEPEMAAGAASYTISKDTWVISTNVQRHQSLWHQGSSLAATPGYSEDSNLLPSRTAENLFWVGRYLERAEGTARFLRTTVHRLLEQGEMEDETVEQCRHTLLMTLSHLTGTLPGFTGVEGEHLRANPEAEILSLIYDRNRVGSLAFTLHSMIHATSAVRERWSSDSWRLIDETEERWGKISRSSNQQKKLPRALDDISQLITNLVAFTGLTLESMTREMGWVMLDLGRRIERGMHVLEVLRLVLSQHYDEALEYQVLESILAANESLITHRRRYRSYLKPQTVLELLLFDASNPRSLAYQIEQLQHHISLLPGEKRGFALREVERDALKAFSTLKLSRIEELLATENGEAGTPVKLEKFLESIETCLVNSANSINHTFFTHALQRQQLVAKPAEAEL